ncbi:unnamed protein product [Rotaria magnacalcarata]|uniref:PPC domain-containing protein n=1 Tax=Rotaria magnacalcarata TaxID=392030 RepID=A0A816Z5W4_9BILA|nr:unnamed protein product [Rotaria magnacalcarata]
MNTVSNMLARKNMIKSEKRNCRPSTCLRCYPLRFGPGVELISTILELMEDVVIQSLFILTCVGTLSQCSLNSCQLTKKEYEIVSLSGTLDKESHNIMGSFADPQTGTLIGGRIRSVTVHTTCELMLVVLLDCIFFREFDSRTGEKKLKKKIINFSIKV